MKKKFSWDMILMCCILAAATTFNITYWSVWHIFDERLANLKNMEQEFSKLSEIKAYVDQYYVTSYEEKTLTDGAAAGYVNALPDDWSYYMTAEEYAEYMDTSKDDYVGIGISGSYDEQYGGIRVLEVYADSPAQEAGIRYFDVIVEVEGQAVSELGFEKAIELMRGEAGTEVTVTVMDAQTGMSNELTVKRAEISEQDVQYEMLEGDIGYIRIKSFSEKVDVQFNEAVRKLIGGGAKGLVFDVRLNPGGRLDVLTNMLDPLMPEGTIIESRDRDGNAKVIKSDAQELDVPMAVLVHEYSISAAEFFAAALQESGKAYVVGSPTRGKGYSQNTFELKDGSALVLSTAEYFTPKGKNLAGIGISPDYEVDLTQEELYGLRTLSHDEDPQLQKAMEVIRQAVQNR